MLKLQLQSPEFLLQLLQRFNRFPKHVEQVHSLLVTQGHILITDLWINTLIYNSLIRTYLEFSSSHTSLILFVDMLRHRAPPNSHTFPSVLKATAFLSRSYRISPTSFSLKAQCVKRGVLDDPFVQTSFISLYSQIGDVTSAHKIFDEIRQPCVVSYNAILDAFGKNGEMGLANSIFLNMPERDVYSWTSIINSCARNENFGAAVSFFKKMMSDDDVSRGLLRPNEATFVTVLSSCANVDDGFALQQGKQIHGYMVRNEKELSVFIGTALIALYGKTGCLNYASKVFDTMSIRKVCTWNALVCSLASNGRESQALHMFEIMKRRGLGPNEVTYVGILSACARKKLVDLGLDLFRSMMRDFSITPRMEHYGCVVDLLGRAGLLREACEFVASMPFKADASVLGALLGACRVHGEVDLGNEVGMQLLALQPDHCGRYVLLSSLYAGAEIWDHAAALRKAMAHASVRKAPAFSVAR